MMVQISQCFPEVKDRYFICDNGDLFSDYGNVKLKEREGRKGYIKNSLVLKNGSSREYFRHRLVLQCFNPNENFKQLQVNHIDGNKQNNNLNNLEWCTCKENRVHAVEHDLAARMIGETNPFHKLTESEVLNIIDDLKSHIPYSILTEKYDCSKGTISSIKNKRNWKYLTKDIDFD